MKILYHHRVASRDGQYVHIEEINKAIKSLGHDIVMVAPTLSDDASFGSDSGLVSKLKQRLPKALYEMLEFLYSFVAFFKVVYTIFKTKPDVMYERYNLFFLGGIWAAKLCNVPLLLEVNSPLFEERDEYGGVALKSFARWTEYYAWRNADTVLPVTHVLADYIKKAGVPDSKIEVIPNGVELSRFNPELFNERKPELEGKCVVGFVGFCREWHHLDKVMRSLASQQRDDIIFLLVGDGPVLEGLKQLAIELKFEKQFISTGLVKRENLPYWLSQIDIALQPAVTPWASPLKMIEYLAMGKAILADDSPNIKELLTHNQDALLFPSGDINAMTESLIQMVDNPVLVQTLSANAKALIFDKGLEWRNNAQRIITLFEGHMEAFNQ